MIITKLCSRCGVGKPVSKFYKNRSRPDGLDTWCKVCVKEYRSTPYMRAVAVKSVMRYRRTERGRELHRQCNARYYQTEKGKKDKARGTKAYQKQHVDKTRAHRAVNDAVRYGKLPSIHVRKCVDCGQQANHYHHESYAIDRFLDVIPLCLGCHGIRHGENQDG